MPAVRPYTSAQLDAVCPVDWAHPSNVGLVGRWQAIPGWTGGRKIVNLARPGDGSATGGHGTLTNMAIPSTATSGWQGPGGRPGGLGSLAFDGSDDVVAVPMLSPDTFTWVASFKYVSTALYTLICDGGASVMLMDVASNSASLWSSDGLANSNLGVTGMTAGTWYTMAFVREGDSITGGYKAYLNGVYKGQANTGTWSPSASLQIGGRVGQSQYHSGHIDDVRIYSRALSAAEVRALYEDSLKGSPATLRWMPTRAYSFAESAPPSVNRRRRVIMCGGR